MADQRRLNEDFDASVCPQGLRYIHNEPQQGPARVRRRAKLTSKQVDNIVRDYQAGLPLQQIAETLNIHRKTVHHNLKRRGVPPRG
ncbi:helix-turn-helix domain-containing protein [Garicola koreensis]|uniref:DNA-binding NarL/FixJ family response regulator n=1 Tax=Garicola koreensis TaxID=1262554 RepID=A0A7W5Y0A0_9MICC|nr:DNA-binding NarL/FixJ family response regulator [Garicola koreensis]